MPFTTSHLLWEEDYLQREKEFMDFISYVPPTKEHGNVWSLRLANQLLLIGSSIDSFFKIALNEHISLSLSDYYEKYPFFQAYQSEYVKFMNNLFQRLSFSEKKRKGSRRLKFVNMNDYREIFELKHDLSNHPVFFYLTGEIIYPFKSWANNESPSWWNVYTNLKHSRVKNRQSATIEEVLYALSALFLLNVYFPLNRKYLIINEVINSKGNQGKTWLLEQLDKDYIDTNTSYLVPIAKTQLFAYLFDDGHYWHVGENAWPEIDPHNIYIQD